MLDDSSRGPGGRRTILGVLPDAVLVWHRGRGHVEREGGPPHSVADPFAAARELLGPCDPGLGDPRGPVGGLIGHIGYDLRTAIEALPDENPSDSSLPDLRLGRYPLVLVKDETLDAAGVTILQCADDPGQEARRDAVLLALRDAVPPPAPYRPEGARPAVSNLSRRAYEERVEVIRELIREGEVYQVNLTQRFLVRCEGQPLAVYEALRQRNPAALGAFIPDPGGAALLSYSPELFLEVAAGRVETRPIKGTLGRGLDPESDGHQARLLAASAKDRAELAMIVDLERNDLNRVCRPGTVAVAAHARVESFPTVHHLVSRVVGELEAGRDVFDLLRAALPCGSITGAPKIRAMEIIDRIENLRRGPYTGAIGWFGRDGGARLNVAIRTLVLEGGHARIHGGGGIVIDSDPASEWEESVVKVRALLAGLGGEIE